MRNLAISLAISIVLFLAFLGIVVIIRDKDRDSGTPAVSSAPLCAMASEFDLPPIAEGMPSVRISHSILAPKKWVIHGANLDGNTYETAESAFEAYKAQAVKK